MNAQSIQTKAGQLPQELQREVLDYIEFLLSEYQPPVSVQKQFRFDWEGGLSALKTQFTSVELQHTVLAWRS